ncbi:transcriptional regulator, TetR family [Halobacillus alkaliphilus]|uniref:Transcriptional regulator, TetR family n=1 Tax=Halobacillus alkaliphilus TaxID=396056 RepID=A0A1I2JVH1_9BACI|nr:TetR/AcrR family transcriptional regulator [Halobacillus alkaliphilus]SFF56791.1 transcriptional regulator, TetR family [Halobacillus alkaliphilus]
MDPKKKNIIEQAIKLFARKGFSSTSVQEIAKECNISKGAFYLHFKSKDELLYELFEHYWRRMQRRVNEVSSEPLEPSEKLVQQLKITIEEVANHREFIIMQIREQVIPFNENIEQFIKKMRYHSYLFYKNHLVSIYGKEAETYAWEGSLITQSLVSNYIDLIIVDNVEFNFLEVADSIVTKVDYMMKGIMENKDAPVITEEIIEQMAPDDFSLSQLDELIRELKEVTVSEAEQDIIDTAEVLTLELERTSPRVAVVKGMASNLEKHEGYLDLASKLRAYFI